MSDLTIQLLRLINEGKTLNEIRTYFWENHYVVVARELTKKFEEFKRWEVSEIINYYEKNLEKVKWEFVIIF